MQIMFSASEAHNFKYEVNKHIQYLGRLSAMVAFNIPGATICLEYVFCFACSSLSLLGLLAEIKSVRSSLIFHLPPHFFQLSMLNILYKKISLQGAFKYFEKQVNKYLYY